MTDQIPQRMLRWHLYGEGLENLRVEEVDVPGFGPDELLVRQDACGLCFSDTKVIGLGANHPRMSGRNLSKDPVTLGHEVSCTVVGVGENLKDRFREGDRFIIQADVFYKGVSMAYGYAIKGGLAEYSVIPESMINGDEGCYLLPIEPESGAVETALVEPWACVVAAYVQAHRNIPKSGGSLLVLPGSESALTAFESEISELMESAKPAASTVPALESIADTDWQQINRQIGVPGYDDIVVIGDVPPESVERAASALLDHGIMAFVGGQRFPRKLSLDIGRIHYNWHHYLGTPTDRISDAYHEERTAQLRAAGIAWFIGAGGPMGQMHVQLAIQLPNPPKLILATDVDSARLQSVSDRFGSAARERGVDLITLNPQTMTPEDFDIRLREISDNRGFDDIVSLVPVAALIEHAADFLANGGWFNIFAGVARGTMAGIDVNAIIHRGVRFIGSSGSSIADMKQTLDKVESGELSTNMSLAAIGGMKAASDGIAAVKEGRFPGKTLIFPRIPDMPLIPLPELKSRYPTVFARLKDGKFWTNEAEAELIRVEGVE